MVRPQPSRRTFGTLIIAALLLLQPSTLASASAPAPPAAPPPDAPYVGDEVVVKLKPGALPESFRPYAPGAQVQTGATVALAALGVTILKVPEGKDWTNPSETGGGKQTNGVDDDGDGYVDDWQCYYYILPWISRQ